MLNGKPSLFGILIKNIFIYRIYLCSFTPFRFAFELFSAFLAAAERV